MLAVNATDAVTIILLTSPQKQLKNISIKSEVGKVNEWISVKDRLPEEKTRVLVFVPHSSIKIDTDRIVGRIWVRWNGHITHWMPLPEPPEEEAHTNGRFDR